MVVNITNTAQLSFFDTLKSVLKSNSTLSRKLRDKNYHEYEPNIQSLSFKDMPYIAMVNENQESEKITVNNTSRIKLFSSNFVLVMDYQARDSFREYAEAIINQVEQNLSSFEALGYFDLEIVMLNRRIELVQNRQVITGEFLIECSGMVENNG